MYSIAYHGGFIESQEGLLGERTLTGASGVYMHKDANHRKAENYIRWVDLCGDGVFWSAKFELLSNRANAVKTPRGTDQWVQRAASVRLCALWVCGRSASQMRDGDAVSPGWQPHREANPTDKRWRMRVGHDCAD